MTNLITRPSKTAAMLIPAALVLALAPVATAQDADDSFNTGRLTLDMGVDFTSSYFFRGYLQEDQGLITQPWMEVGFDLTPDDSGVDIGLAVGTWNSLHSEKTGATGTGQRGWYESDFYAGLTFGFEHVDLGLSYTFYTYPNNDSFPTVQEVGLTAGFGFGDSWASDWIGDVTLGLHIEVDNSNVSSEEAMYFQIDFGPSFDLESGGMTLSVPVSIGLSVDDYYVGTEDEDFGYASIGATLDVPLSSGPWGDWSLNAGVTFLLLGDTTEASNNGDDSDVVGFFGVSLSY
ncbi:MAG: TorF family putative porin [Phycisphaerales bacterium]